MQSDNRLAPSFLSFGGEMGEWIHAQDWRSSPVGPIESWPRSLRSALGLMLESPQPISVMWGPEHILFFNDAYKQILGTRFPGVLGCRFLDLSAELWPDFLPLVGRAFAGESISLEDWPMTTMRDGVAEETWWSFSLSPIRDECGDIVGLFCIKAETTRKVLAQRHVASEADRLRRMFEQAPGFMALLEGPQHVFTAVNEAYYELVGRRQVIGLSVREALPDMKGQGLFNRLDKALETGRSYCGRNTQVNLCPRPGVKIQKYIDFVVNPVRSADGSVTTLFVQGHDVTRQKQALDAMEKARKSEQAANRAKSQFLAAASHDLRQPFQAMTLFHDVLVNSALDGRARIAVEGLGQAINSGSELLHALLDLSALDAGQVVARPESFKIGELFAELAKEYKEVAAQKGLRFKCVAFDETVITDRILLKRLVRNLLNNALRYTDHGGILLGARRQGGELCLQVVDTGIGVPNEYLEDIYEEFFQVGNYERERTRGLGLGLSIVKKTAALLGHRLTVRSVPGRGSTFGVCLPRSDPAQCRSPRSEMSRALGRR